MGVTLWTGTQNMEVNNTGCTHMNLTTLRQTVPNNPIATYTNHTHTARATSNNCQLILTAQNGAVQFRTVHNSAVQFTTVQLTTESSGGETMKGVTRRTSRSEETTTCSSGFGPSALDPQRRQISPTMYHLHDGQLQDSRLPARQDTRSDNSLPARRNTSSDISLPARHFQQNWTPLFVPTRLSEPPRCTAS